jgi:hypothetical protein
MTVVLKRKYEVTRKTMFGEEVVHSEFTTETCDVCGDTGYVHVHYYEFGDGEERALCQSCDQGEQ